MMAETLGSADGFRWQYTLRREKLEDKVGFSIKFELPYHVTDIAPGMLASVKNKKLVSQGVPQIAERELRPFDVVEVVNGHHDADAIRNELKNAHELHMRMFRPYLTEANGQCRRS